MKLRFLLLFIAAGATSSWSQDGYYTPEKILQFARHLYDSGDYIRAASEYQRYRFIDKDTSGTDSLLFKIGFCYKKGGKPERAVGIYEHYLRQHPDGPLSDQSRYQIALTRFETGQYDSSISCIHSFLPHMQSENTAFTLQTMIGLNYLLKKRWELAHGHFTSLGTSPYNHSDTRLDAYKTYAARGLHLKKKSYFRACLLSTLIPGMGKIYAGRRWDGIFSMLSVGLFGIQAYDGFNRDGRHSVKGWVYGSLTGIFYLGNIYGTMIAVKIHNTEIEDRLVKQIKIELQL